MKRHKKEEEREDARIQYRGFGLVLRIAVIFCYAMWGLAIIFFFPGIIGIFIPFLLPLLAASFSLAFFAFMLLIQIRLFQLVQDIELNTRRSADASNVP